MTRSKRVLSMRKRRKFSWQIATLVSLFRWFKSWATQAAHFFEKFKDFSILCVIPRPSMHLAANCLTVCLLFWLRAELHFLLLGCSNWTTSSWGIGNLGATILEQIPPFPDAHSTETVTSVHRLQLPDSLHLWKSTFHTKFDVLMLFQMIWRHFAKRTNEHKSVHIALLGRLTTPASFTVQRISHKTISIQIWLQMRPTCQHPICEMETYIRIQEKYKKKPWNLLLGRASYMTMNLLWKYWSCTRTLHFPTNLLIFSYIRSLCTVLFARQIPFGENCSPGLSVMARGAKLCEEWHHHKTGTKTWGGDAPRSMRTRCACIHVTGVYFASSTCCTTPTGHCRQNPRFSGKRVNQQTTRLLSEHNF